MSRTTRTMPRWVLRDIKHRNNYVNGYRGCEFFCRGLNFDEGNDHRGNTRGMRVFKNTVAYSTDNGIRELRYCKNSVGSVNGWLMSEAGTQLAKAFARKMWARANRRHAKCVIEEQLRDVYDAPTTDYTYVPICGVDCTDYVPDDDYYDYEYLDYTIYYMKAG